MSVVVSALSHNYSGKAVAGKAVAAQEAGKRSSFLSKKRIVGSCAEPAGVSPFLNWDISLYNGSGSSDMIVEGAL